MFGVLAALLGGGFMAGTALAHLVAGDTVRRLGGRVCTVPYIGGYGLDALRDATIWGYGAFAILVAGFMLRLHWWTKASDAYARWFWWFAFWSPVAGVIFATVEPSIPRVPGTEIPLLFVKAGDFGVQLAGAATFVLVGLADSHWPRDVPIGRARMALVDGVVRRGGDHGRRVPRRARVRFHRGGDRHSCCTGARDLEARAVVAFVFALLFVGADIKFERRPGARGLRAVRSSRTCGAS